MLLALLVGLANNAEQAGVIRTEAEQAGHDVGLVLGFMVILAIWAFGAAILGALAYFTRGRTEPAQFAPPAAIQAKVGPMEVSFTLDGDHHEYRLFPIDTPINPAIKAGEINIGGVAYHMARTS